MNEVITVAESQRLEVLESVIDAGMQTFVHVGNALLEIRDSRLYRQTHGTFEDYCRERWGMQRNYANKLIAAAEVATNLGTTVPILPTAERQIRPLTTLEPEQQREAWQRAVETATNGKVTAAHVQAVVNEYRKPAEMSTPYPLPAWAADDDDEEESEESVFDAASNAVNVEDANGHVETFVLQPAQTLKPHVSFNSGNNEWYTPVEYIEAARRVMGAIELDPASSDIANQTVKAEIYYTVEDDGLSQHWQGRTWMNPPYASDLIGCFATKLVEHVENGDIPEAIILVNNATETAWFQDIISVASSVVFPRGRVRFWKPDGETGAPLQGQALIYIGVKPCNFNREFSRFGWEAMVNDSH
jgi:phage N-6-adenine-methyltransferase